MDVVTKAHAFEPETVANALKCLLPLAKATEFAEAQHPPLHVFHHPVEDIPKLRIFQRRDLGPPGVAFVNRAWSEALCA